MEKQFNLIIDTKRTGFNAVRGFKQEENNSVLYINLVQNSVPFDLTGLTVRINFRRPDGQVLLQMVDVISATEGKIKVNILTKVLGLVGEVRADLSIFNKENEKITSAPLSLFIDPSIYTNDYITKNDEFDIIQRVWTSEDERIRAENKRKENETNRQSTENTRIANEDSRKVEETKRSNNEKTREDNEIER
ncbi:BppU family phage baseplate upper protein, partial [Clostridium botulinum]|nr:BppU family phage baseplate upper protein [Clostridium botulinum]